MLLLDTHIWHWWVNQIPGKLSQEIIKLIEAVNLPEHHKDPQDRIIIATALHYGADLLSFDSAFSAYGELEGRLICA